MFLSEHLLYVEMHRTGSTHIVDLLERAVPGRRMGKHNRPRRYPTDRLIVTSVRDPWDWYLSLWTFGCNGQGALYHRLTGSPPGGAATPAGETAEWRALYADPRDPGRFRAWLQRIHDPDHAQALGEGYADSPFRHEIGFYTFRFLRFALDDAMRLDGPAGPGDTAAALHARHGAVDRVIRTEHLAHDLLATLEAAGSAADAATASMIRERDARPANASGRGRTADFHDAGTARLVARRERPLVDGFGYRPPDV